MLERARAGDCWSMELIELDAPEFDPFYMHTVFRQGQAIGMVTSGGFGHRLQKAIALVYFRTPVASSEEIEVEILGRRVGARITAPL